MKRIPIFIFIIALFFSCNSGKKENPSAENEHTQQVIVDSQLNTTKATEGTVEVSEVPDSQKTIGTPLYQKYHQLKQMHDRLPYYLPIDSGYFFVTVKGEWSGYEVFENKTYVHQIGLVNENNESILPVRYHHLGNPGIFGNYWIEIQQNQYKGLFNLKTRQLIEPKYDMIVPVKDSTILALAKKDIQNIIIDADGNQIEASELTENLNFLGLKEGTLFSITDNNLIPYYTTELFHSEKEEPMKDVFMSFEEGAGVIYAPLYLSQLNISNPLFSEIEVKEQNEAELYFTTDKGASSVYKISTITENIKAFFTKFIESGASSRGYFIEKEKLLTINKKNQLIDSTHLIKDYDGRYLRLRESYSVLGDTLIEIVKSGGSFLEYFNFPEYSYKWIQTDGKIKPLNTNRKFAFTKFVKINQEYFKHTLYKENKEGITDYVPGKFNILTFKHFSIEDLDIMRNEIFAEYGYRFKSDKLKQYFSKQLWYEPIFDNVDDQLSEIEKHNIEVILKVKQDMLQNEADYRKKKATFFSAPA